jgi:hypothetical protein
VRRLALALAAAAAFPGVTVAPPVATEPPPASVAPVNMGLGATYWSDRGFVEMTPPLRFPSADGREHTVVWLKLPDGAPLSIVRHNDGSVSWSYPTGTIAERVDLADGSDPRSVVDVRGTRFDAEEEYFHVLHRTSGDYAGDLGGLEWRRGDMAAGRLATERMLERLAVGRGLLPEDAPADPELEQFARHNDCASCHIHGKPERRMHPYPGASDEGLPNRATDTKGLYAIASVLSDSAPLDMSRALDMNTEDPFIRATCQEEAPARLMMRRGAGRVVRGRRYVCDDGSIPRGRLDMRAAVANADPHALAVCRSRRYLFEHMDEGGRRAFSEVLGECEPRAGAAP